jgi:deazaflavin-dependent oxidoreductase (nitroreductase family)
VIAVWYFTPSPRALALITAVHRGLYRATGGILGATLPQLEGGDRGPRLRKLDVLLLTTTGRKSAVRRTIPLPFFVYVGRAFLVASIAGRDQHPAWYLNLVARPEVEVQWRMRRRRCRAVTLQGSERAHFWTTISDDWPRYREYQQATRREIPIVELIDVTQLDRADSENV